MLWIFLWVNPWWYSISWYVVFSLLVHSPQSVIIVCFDLIIDKSNWNSSFISSNILLSSTYLLWLSRFFPQADHVFLMSSKDAKWLLEGFFLPHLLWSPKRYAFIIGLLWSITLFTKILVFPPPIVCLQEIHNLSKPYKNIQCKKCAGLLSVLLDDG